MFELSAGETIVVFAQPAADVDEACDDYTEYYYEAIKTDEYPVPDFVQVGIPTSDKYTVTVTDDVIDFYGYSTITLRLREASVQDAEVKTRRWHIIYLVCKSNAVLQNNISDLEYYLTVGSQEFALG